MDSYKLAWISTHPVQYQTPLLRLISQQKNINLTTIFFNDFSIREYIDPEFGNSIKWDIPLTDGYNFTFLTSSLSNNSELIKFFLILKGLLIQLSSNKFDIILIQGWNHYGYFLAAIIAKFFGIKLLLRSEASSHINNSKGLRKIFKNVFLKKYFTYIDYFASIGSKNYEFYIQMGVTDSKIGKIPYAVDNDFFQSIAADLDINLFKKSLGLSINRPIILYAGKLTKRKKSLDLIDAFISLTIKNLDFKPYLIIIGEGELKENINSKIADYNLNHSIFSFGFCNQYELAKFYAIADIFVLTSINETWGLTVNEAMNGKTAILVSNQVGSGYDLVKNGINGCVINEINTKTISQSLVYMLENDRYLSMGAKSLEIINTWNFSQDIIGLNDCLANCNITKK